jgi:hypothetical protein
VDAQISPDPTELERRAIAAALGSPKPPQPYASRWRMAALADLRRDDLNSDSAAEELRSDPRIVEP